MAVEILGVKIDELDLNGVIGRINELLDGGIGYLLATVNPEFILAAQKNEEFKKTLNTAVLNTADGIGVVWAARILKHAKLPRVTGVDLCQQLFEGRCPEAKIFLLGGAPGVAEEVRIKFPNSWIVGAESGGELVEANWELADNQNILDRINASGANLLLVAFGQVRQEMWLARNLGKIPAIRVAVGVGGSFDYLSGQVKRAPGWLRAIGLEWFYRLIKEPKRFNRIWNATVVFGWLVIKEKFK